MILNVILEVLNSINSRGVNQYRPVSRGSVHNFHDSFGLSLIKNFLNHSQLTVEIITGHFMLMVFLSVAHTKYARFHTIEPLLIHEVSGYGEFKFAPVLLYMLLYIWSEGVEPSQRGVRKT